MASKRNKNFQPNVVSSDEQSDSEGKSNGGVESTLYQQLKQKQTNLNKKPTYSILSVSDVKDPFFKAAFQGNISTMKSYFQEMKQHGVSQQEQWNKAIMGFFMAVWNEQVKSANNLLKMFELLQVLVSKIVPKDSDFINQEEEDSNSKFLSNSQNSLLKQRRFSALSNIKQLKNVTPISGQEDSSPSPKKMKTHNKKSSKNFLGVNKDSSQDDKQNSIPNSPIKTPISDTDNQIQGVSIKTVEDIKIMKRLFKQEQAEFLITNVLKIALNYQEDMIAAVIVAHHFVNLSENIVDYAIASQSEKFLHNIFYYEKSYVFDYETMVNGQPEVKFITLEQLLKRVCEVMERPEAINLIERIMRWELKTTENLLQILCSLGFQQLALDFKNDFLQFSTFDFFYNCLSNGYEDFLKVALKKQFFDLNYLFKNESIDYLLEALKEGDKLIFVLNVCLYADLKKWPIIKLKQFIWIARQITFDFNNSYMYVVHNPILLLGLFIETLRKIDIYYNVLDIDCRKMIAKMKNMGKIFVENMKFDQVEKIFSEKDYTNRTVLQIITYNDIKPFIVKAKLRFLFNKIWDGKDSDLIDGKLSHFSKTYYLLSHRPVSLPGSKLNITDIIGSTSFKPNIDDYNFSYQMKFRRQSIRQIFLKDFLCACVIICVFQYNNYQYLNLFTIRKYGKFQYEGEQIAIIKNSLQQYNSISFLGTVLSISYFLGALSRLIFNTFAKNKIPFDIWVAFDAVSGVVNIVASNFIGNSAPESFINQTKKHQFDYFMILVLVISWLRFFSYFLVYDTIAKLTITLFKMLQQMISFIIIAVFQMLLMTSVFCLLFRDVDPEDNPEFLSLWLTFRLLYDYMLANYGIIDMGNAKENYIYSGLYICQCIISNIFLLNFLIAIIQDVYSIMVQHGDFYSAQYQYMFISKYIMALEDKSGYEELIMYPPPLNYITLPLMFIAPSSTTMKKYGHYFYHITFWIENLFIIFGHLFYFMSLSFVIYFKNVYHILFKVYGSKNKITNIFAWIILGPLYLLYTNVVDTCILINILCMQHSQLFEVNELEKKKSDIFKLNILKDVGTTIALLYDMAQNTSEVLKKRFNLTDLVSQNMDVKDRMYLLEQEGINVEEIFQVPQELVIETYKQVALKNSQTIAYRRQANAKKNKSKSIVFSSFKDLSDKQHDKRGNVKLDPDFVVLVNRSLVSKDTNIKDLTGYGVDQHKKLQMRKGLTQLSMIEKDILGEFIDKMVMVSRATATQVINLQLLIKIFPKVLSLEKMYQIDLFNFYIMQKTLISYFNDDQDEMFTFYDNRMHQRINQVSTHTEKNSKMSTQIMDLTNVICNYINWNEKVSKTGSITNRDNKGPNGLLEANTQNKQEPSRSSNKNDQDELKSERKQQAETQIQKQLTKKDKDQVKQNEGIHQPVIQKDDDLDVNAVPPSTFLRKQTLNKPNNPQNVAFQQQFINIQDIVQDVTKHQQDQKQLQQEQIPKKMFSVPQNKNKLRIQQQQQQQTVMKVEAVTENVVSSVEIMKSRKEKLQKKSPNWPHMTKEINDYYFSGSDKSS